jgi:hypothetical protein
MPKSSVLLGIFCEQNNSVQRILIKKCLLFIVGSVCHIKQLKTGLRNSNKDIKSRRWWNGGAKVAETAVKRLPCCGVQCTGKAVGQVYQCWWRITCFVFYIHLWHIYWLALVCWSLVKVVIPPLLHTNLSLPYEMCDVPDQAAHYHILSL